MSAQCAHTRHARPAGPAFRPTGRPFVADYSLQRRATSWSPQRLHVMYQCVWRSLFVCDDQPNIQRAVAGSDRLTGIFDGTPTRFMYSSRYVIAREHKRKRSPAPRISRAYTGPSRDRTPQTSEWCVGVGSAESFHVAATSVVPLGQSAQSLRRNNHSIPYAARLVCGSRVQHALKRRH